MLELVNRVWDQLLERTAGPFHFRFVLQPLVAIILGIRAGLRDAADGRPPYLQHFLLDPSRRRELLHSCWKDVGRVLVIGLMMDAVYQLFLFRRLYLRQALFVAFLLAIVPYILVRGPANRIASRRASGRAHQRRFFHVFH